MKQQTKSSNITVGLDLGDRRHRFCALDERGEVVEQDSICNDRVSLRKLAGRYHGALGVMALCEFMNPDNIHALETAAIVVAGTLTGSELAVAVFFHPRISRLEDAVHVRAAQTLAKVLGMVMPFWYALTFLLALAVTFVAHTTRSTPWWLALASTALFALISVYSVLLPVPINNQVARWQPDSLPANWRDLRRRWDLLHAIRVAFLVIALILLVASCVY